MTPARSFARCVEVAAVFAWLRSVNLWAWQRKYDGDAKAYLERSGHYLDNVLPGALYAVGVEPLAPGLVGDAPSGRLVGLCVVGRPAARMLPQDGTTGEVTRLVLTPGQPRGLASMLLRVTAEVGRRLGLVALLTYHDRTRHTGCIYKKAGFRKDGKTAARSATEKAWANRPGRAKSADAARTSKRRWRLELVDEQAA